MVDDRRKRPWRKLRVVVEVTVPPNSRATEKHLMHQIGAWLPESLSLPNPLHTDSKVAVVRLKTFTSFWPAFLRLEKGIKPHFKKKGST